LLEDPQEPPIPEVSTTVHLFSKFGLFIFVTQQLGMVTSHLGGGGRRKGIGATCSSDRKSIPLINRPKGVKKKRKVK
jgi:hypothetical protein